MVILHLGIYQQNLQLPTQKPFISATLSVPLHNLLLWLVSLMVTVNLKIYQQNL